MPERIQVRRTKGYRKPKDAVYVGRPSKWGNPYPVKLHGEVVVEWFERELVAAIEDPWGQPHTLPIRVIAESIEELRGKDLACWCRPGDVCHADVLLDLANRPNLSAQSDSRSRSRAVPATEQSDETGTRDA